jgi:hypothetical protein
MKTATILTHKKHHKLGTIVLSVALAALIGGLTSVPARADGDDGRGRDVQQERNDKARHPVHHVRQVNNRYEAPSYVYAPPPVYYVQPPQQPAIDLIFPLNFR